MAFSSPPFKLVLSRSGVLLSCNQYGTEPKRGQDSQPWLHLWRKLLMATSFPPHLLALIFTFPFLLFLSQQAPCWLSHPIPCLPKKGKYGGREEQEPAQDGGRGEVATGVHAVTEGKRRPPKALKASLVP